MGRLTPFGVILLFVAGCAGGSKSQVPEWKPRLEELASAQSRLEMRFEEVTRNLLALRTRLEAQESALRQHEETRSELEQPLKVVKLEPVPRASVPPSAVGPADPADTDASDLYRRAFNNYKESKFGDAILDFEDFLRHYPDHEYADNAQYWIGESYYSQAQFEQALAEFNRVLDRYPQESKAPDSLLKIGLCYQKLGDQNRARAIWNRLVAQKPDTEAARQAQKLLISKP
jgi:tol-pal system protein YbgF